MSRKLLGFFRALYERFGYRDMSIQNKIISTFLILIIIPLIVYYVIFGVYTNNTKEKEIQLIEQLNRQAVDGIDAYVTDVMQLTMQPLYNEDLLSILSKINHNYEAFVDQKKHNFIELPGNKMGEEKRIIVEDEDKEITNLIRIMRAYKKYIRSVFFFQNNGDSVYYTLAYGQLIDPYNPSKEDWFIRCKELNGAPVVSGITGIPNMLPKDPYGGNYVFTISRAIKDNNTIDVLGYLSIFSDVGLLREQCAKIKSINGERIVILDSKNTIVYDMNENNISKSIDDASTGLMFLQDENLKTDRSFITMEEKRHLLMVNNINSPQWKLVRIIPENALYVNARSVQGKLIFLIILFTILSLLMSIAISYGITKPMKKLTKTMELVQKGDLSIRFQAKHNDEIGQLGIGFNNMIGEIECLINDVYIADVKKKEAELSALQAQINPHFIYNTLESIRMMAKINDDKEAADMIFLLGRLLRYSINTKRQLVSIRDEIEHLKNYMKLQNCRFENKFELLVDMPEVLMNVSIVKLVFQPIVENAIYHALERVDWKGLISIRGKQDQSIISVEIEDNGIGMTVQQVEKLSTSVNDFSSSQGEGRGIGLRNINERIKLYYGDRYGIKFFSEPGKGTVVRIELPNKEIMNRPCIE